MCRCYFCYTRGDSKVCGLWEQGFDDACMIWRKLTTQLNIRFCWRDCLRWVLMVKAVEGDEELVFWR